MDNDLIIHLLENLVPALGVCGLAGILVGWRITISKHKLRQRELDIEELRLQNESRALELEQQRLRLVLDDNARNLYNQLPR
jgi:hypothetical protein